MVLDFSQRRTRTACVLIGWLIISYIYTSRCRLGLIDTILYNGMMLGLSLVMLRHDYGLTLVHSWRSFFRGLPEGVGFGLALALVMYFVLPKLGFNRYVSQSSRPFLNFCFNLAIQMIYCSAEEAFCRGYLYEGLKSFVPHQGLAIVIVSLIFGALHIHVKPMMFPVATVISMYFFLLKSAYGNRWFSVVVWTHVSYNMFMKIL